MTSNAIRGIRRKKSSLCEVKVAVIGAPGVGKSGEYYVFITNLAPSHCLLSQIERNVHLFFFFFNIFLSFEIFEFFKYFLKKLF